MSVISWSERDDEERERESEYGRKREKVPAPPLSPPSSSSSLPPTSSLSLSEEQWRKKAEYEESVCALKDKERRLALQQVAQAERCLRQKSRQIDFILSQLSKEKQTAQVFALSHEYV